MVASILLVALALPSQVPDPEMVRKVYEVGDLLERAKSSPETQPIRHPWSAGPMVLERDSEHPWEFHGDEEWELSSIVSILNQVVVSDPETLEDSLVKEVPPDAVQVAGSLRAQADVEETLGILRATVGARSIVELAFVSPGDLGRHGGLDAVLESARKEGRQIELALASGRMAEIHVGRSLDVLADAEVNQTGAIPVVNPVIERIQAGVSIEAEMLVIGPEGMRLRLRATRLEPLGDPVKRKVPHMDVEFQELDEETFETTMFLAPGRASLAGSFRLRGAGGKERERALVVRARPQEAVMAASDGRSLLVRDLAFLLEPLRGETASTTEHAVLAALREGVHPGAWEEEEASLSIQAERFLVARAAPSVLDDVRKALDAWSAIRSRSLGALLEAFVGPREAVQELQRLAGQGAVLPDGWRASLKGLEPVIHLELGGMAGAEMTARALTTRPFVRNLEVVSVGVGAATDPVPERAGTGLKAIARMRETARPDGVELRLDLDLARTDFSDSITVFVPVSKDSADDTRSTGSARMPTWQWTPAKTDLPRQELLRVRETHYLKRGASRLVRAQEWTGGRQLVLVASVGEGLRWNRDELSSSLGNFEGLPDLDKLFVEEFDVPARLFLEDGDRAPLGLLEPPDIFEISFGTVSSPESIFDATQGLFPGEAAQQAWERVHGMGNGLLLLPEESDVTAVLTPLQLRAARRFWIEATLVPASSLEAASPGSLGPGATPFLADDVLDRAILDAGMKAASIATSTASGSPVRLTPGGRGYHIVDHELIETGPIPVHRPRIALVVRGLFVEATVLPEPTGRRARVDLRLGRAEDAAPPERRRIHTGEVLLVRERRDEVCTSILVPTGRTVVAGMLPPGPAGEGTGAQGPLVAILRVRSQELPPHDPLVPEIYFFDRSALETPLPPFRLRSREEDDSRSNAIRVPRTGVDLVSLIKDSLEAAGSKALLAYGGQEFVVRGSPEDAALVARKLEEVLAPFARAVQVDLWMGSVDAASLPPSDDPGGEAARKLMEGPGERLRLVGLHGAPLHLDALVLHGYLSHLEAVSGGTGNLIIEVSDPVIAHHRHGIQAAARVQLLEGNREALLDLHVRRGGPPRFRKRPVRAAQGLPLDRPLDEITAERPVPVMVDIDLPEAETHRFERRLTVPLGRPTVLETIPDPAAPGRARVLAVLVTAPEEGR